MGRHSTPDHFIEKQKPQTFNPRDPEMEMLLRGLLHELRNPLSSILTAATLLQDSPLPDEPEIGEESRMLLDVVKKESLRLNHILTEFAGYIKLPPPHLANFDLAQSARAAIQELQRERVLQPPVAVQDALPESCQAWGDESQIRTAISHILRNASEAMPAGGEIHLAAIAGETSSDTSSDNSEDSENVTICIADSGKGFTPESRDRAFQPFYSSKEHRVGLGLSSVRNLVEASSGQVWLEENSFNAASGNAEQSTPHASQITSSLSVCLRLPRAKS